MQHSPCRRRDLVNMKLIITRSDHFRPCCFLILALTFLNLESERRKGSRKGRDWEDRVPTGIGQLLQGLGGFCRDSVGSAGIQQHGSAFENNLY